MPKLDVTRKTLGIAAAAVALLGVGGALATQADRLSGDPAGAVAAATFAPGTQVSYLVSGKLHTGYVLVVVNDNLALVSDDIAQTTQRHLPVSALTDLTPTTTTTATTTAATTTAPPPADTQAPSVPQGQGFGPITQTTVELHWDAATDNVAVTGYRLFKDGVSVATTQSLTHTFTGLACATVYSFALEAYDAAGNASDRAAATGAATTAACDTPPPVTTTAPTTTTSPPPPPPPPSDLANAWIDTSGGTCAYSATPVAYSDAAACGSIQAAWAKLAAGNTARMRPGTYGQQVVTGNKTAPTFVTGEAGVIISGATPAVCGYQDGLVCASANYLNLTDVTVDSGSAHGQSIGSEIIGSNVTFTRVNFYGSFVSLYPKGPNFTWRIGSLGKDGVAGGQRSCNTGDGEPVWVESSATRATFDQIKFNSMSASGAACSGSVDGFHLEYVRVQEAQNVTISNSVFVNDAGTGNGAGSGKIFVTASSSSSSAANGLKLLGNTFGSVKGSYAIQTHTNVANANGWQVKNNAFVQGVVTPTVADASACLNTGPVDDNWRDAC